MRKDKTSLPPAEQPVQEPAVEPAIGLRTHGARRSCETAAGPAGAGGAHKPPPRASPGRSASGMFWCATFMKRLHTSTGSPPPVAFLVGEESSLPSHTPVTRWPV